MIAGRVLARVQALRGRGLTLVEALAALVILSAFVVAAAAWAGGAARLSAAASHGTSDASALAQAVELLRRDLAERPIEPAQERRRRRGTVERLPFDPLIAPEARSITLVTASFAQGDGRGPMLADGWADGWRTVAWRFDAARGELLRGSWAYEPAHVAASPIAQAGDGQVRVALRGVERFEITRTAVEHDDERSPARATRVWTAEITLQDSPATVVRVALGPVVEAPGGGGGGGGGGER